MKYNYMPTIKELQTSLKLRSREYLLENTLHGVPYFVDRSRPKWERITWFLLTMTSLGATIGIIVSIWHKFETEPTLTGVNTLPREKKIDFPRIFICYDWEQLNHTVLDESEVYIYEQLYNWRWGQAVTLKSTDTVYEEKNNIREVFEAMAPDCALLFGDDCTFTGKRRLCKDVFVKTLTPSGACCKFNASVSVGILDSPWELKFEATTYPFKLYLLHRFDSGPARGERPLMNVHFPIDVQFRHELTLTDRDIRHLTRNQRQCHYEEEYSLSDCESSYMADRILKQCDCLPWFLSSPGKTECPITKYPCVKTSYVDITKSSCILPCEHTSYGVRRTAKLSSEPSVITLSHWPTLVSYRKTKFGYLDLLVSFGGIAGLFLGYSLLTTVELGYYFSLKAYCGAVIESSRKRHNITKVRAIDVKPEKLDVYPMYYRYVD